MEFTIQLFKCDTCSDCEGHPEEQLFDVLVVPPQPQPQTGVPLTVCGMCRQQMDEAPSDYTVIDMDLH